MIVGIDPGVNTGFAVYKDGQLELHTLTFWGATSRLLAEPPDKVYLEDPNLISPTFLRNVSKRGLLKIAQNVGMNKRDAQLMLEFCRDVIEVDVELVKPTTKKWGRHIFQRVTGITKPVSQHARDAAKLLIVYGGITLPGSP